MYQVTKIIRFCYGHRLLNYEGKCRHLHGHNAKAEITLSASGLDHRGMVMDFDEVRSQIQTWVDATLDHKMLLHEKDPVIPHLLKEKEPFVPVPENPTAEVLARMIFDHATRAGLPVTAVRLWETETSHATYAPACEQSQLQPRARPAKRTSAPGS